MKGNASPVFVWIYIPGWVSINFVYTVLNPQYSHVGTLFNISMSFINVPGFFFFVGGGGGGGGGEREEWSGRGGRGKEGKSPYLFTITPPH